jgi:hypothetical protein
MNNDTKNNLIETLMHIEIEVQRAKEYLVYNADLARMNASLQNVAKHIDNVVDAHDEIEESCDTYARF